MTRWRLPVRSGPVRRRAPCTSVRRCCSASVSAPSRAATPGIIVRDVMRGGPADQAGVAIGDVIMVLDGTSLDSATTLTYVLDRHYPGDVVDLTWIDRSGQQRAGKATLVSGP